MQQILSGLPAAPGVGIGTTYVYRVANRRGEGQPRPRVSLQAEWDRFMDAQQRVDQELLHLIQLGDPMMGDIFASHREILHDKTLTEMIYQGIVAGLDASQSAREACGHLVQIFQELSDSYFASRATDIQDVSQRLMAHLDGVSLAERLRNLPPDTILIADELSPFDTAYLSPEQVRGVALSQSAPTAHTAILARSLGIPMICSLGAGVLNLDSGHLAIVDGMHGRIFINPDPETLNNYRETQHRLFHYRAMAEAQSHEDAVTQDGARVPVRLNVNSREDVLMTSVAGADGVGLLRTEYLFQKRTTPPSVAEQKEAYAEIAAHFPDRTMTVRLLDVGGDKPVHYLPQPPESNPFLGIRGIRLLLEHPHLLEQQLQALVALALDDPPVRFVRILVPFVSKVKEVQQVRQMLEQIPGAKGNLGRGKRIQLGVMIEVPAAAMLADKFAPLVDFFSIGTNDLSQYTLAADRVNSHVAALATPLDPAVLRLIARTCTAAAGEGIPVAVCGEMAGDPSVLPLLVGLGVSEVSVVSPSVALVKHAARQIHLEQARQLAAQALDCSRVQEVQQLLSLTTFPE